MSDKFEIHVLGIADSKSAEWLRDLLQPRINHLNDEHGQSITAIIVTAKEEEGQHEHLKEAEPKPIDPTAEAPRELFDDTSCEY